MPTNTRKATLKSTILAAALVAAAGSFATAATAATAATTTTTETTKTTVADDLPTGKEVHDAYIEALGGEDAIRKLETRLTKGSFGIPQMGINAPLTIKQMTPAYNWFELEIPGFTKVTRGTDGEIAWELDAINGARLLEGAELATTIRDAGLHYELEPMDHYKSLETTGKETRKGEEVYVVVYTPKGEGEPETHYFSVESGLRVATAATQPSPQGDVEAIQSYSDYREVDGVMIPFSLDIETSIGVNQSITIESVEHGVEMKKEDFAPPAEVKALLDI